MEQELTHIRNFCIVAHIDHGKSTLADRLLEYCGNINARERRDQLLDQMDLERERGITIKASAATLKYQADDGLTYELNLIDTPGHVDFSYEVSRSMAACEGALLLVDAVHGIQAQTVANCYLALENNLEIVPVINKIDMSFADIARVSEELKEFLGFRPEEIVLASAKEGIGTKEVLEAIVKRLPAPKGDPDAPLKALIFDSAYDSYVGAVAHIRLVDGKVSKRDMLKIMSTGKQFEVDEVGIFTPRLQLCEELSAGQVGYVIAGIKEVRDTRSGDTITSAVNPATTPLPGYSDVKPMVFCGLYPVNGEDYPVLADAIEKLKLNDASFSFEPESSVALGFGYRCGFLGLLHMEISVERLRREFGLELIATAPSVVYRVHLTSGEIQEIDSPAKFPSAERLAGLEEPIVLMKIFTPEEYIGPCMELAQERRGVFQDMHFDTRDRVTLTYKLPLAEMLMEFMDQLKSRTRGYASFDYDFCEYTKAELSKVDVMINHEVVDALSFITHKSLAERRGRALVEKLKEVIDRQLFEVRIQAAIGSRIIASAKLTAYRKDVIAKCYGGDITRKRKLLDKQKEGKKRMKQIGKVEVPQEAFLSVLRLEREQ